MESEVVVTDLSQRDPAGWRAIRTAQERFNEVETTKTPRRPLSALRRQG
jgi:hypothetical protein